MKKYLKLLIIAIIIGGILAAIFYHDIKREVKAIVRKEEIINIFQVGVFKDYDNATNFSKNFASSLIYVDGNYYRVIIAVTYHEEVTKKLESIYLSEEIDYYLKELRVNKSFIEEIKAYENILLKTDNLDVINSLNNSILGVFSTYLN